MQQTRSQGPTVLRHPANDRGTSAAADSINGVVRLGVTSLIENDGKGVSR
jgi:hypothetical protein